MHGNPTILSLCLARLASLSLPLSSRFTPRYLTFACFHVVFACILDGLVPLQSSSATIFARPLLVIVCSLESLVVLRFAVVLLCRITLLFNSFDKWPVLHFVRVPCFANFVVVALSSLPSASWRSEARRQTMRTTSQLTHLE